MKLPVLFTGIVFSAFSAAAMPEQRQPDEPAIRSLVVNANVTVVLVDHPDQKIEMNGDPIFMNEVNIRRINGALVIDGNRGRNFKSRGMIYIPARALEQISINHSAFVRSSSTLHLPKLKIKINGSCKIHISTVGKIDFVETDLFEIDYRVMEKTPALNTVAISHQ